MNSQSATKTMISQDRNLLAPAANAPLNSWARLTAGDEKAEKLEGFFRTMLVVSLLCAMAICALRLQPADTTPDNLQMAGPSVRLTHLIERAPAAAVQAALPANAAF